MKKYQHRRLIGEECIKRMYSKVRGIEISNNYQRQHPIDNTSTTKEPSLTYGEVVVSSFISILAFIDNYNKTHSAIASNDRVFVDLGSGTGKAVYIAALTSNSGFTKVWGIELIPDLVNVSILLNDQLNTIIHRLQSSSSSSSSSIPTPPALSSSNNKKMKPKDTISSSELIDIIRLRLTTTVDSISSGSKIDTLANNVVKDIGK